MSSESLESPACMEMRTNRLVNDTMVGYFPRRWEHESPLLGERVWVREDNDTESEVVKPN